MKKLKKGFVSLICVLTVAFTLVGFANAADYSKSVSKTVTLGGASATVKCTGTYHSTGNTRWSKGWFATISSGKNAYTGSEAISSSSETKMVTTAKVYITNNSLVTNSTTKTTTFTRSGTTVSGSMN